MNAAEDEAFAPELLALLSREAEVDVETTSASLAAHRATVWIVVVDGTPYLRSVRGDHGRWWRELSERGLGAIHVAGRRIPVRAAAADEAGTAACSAALRRKYAHDPSTPSMLRPEVLGTTLKLLPG